ncbi:protein YgfX [Photobacterium sp. 1_MG-2023]|uniref:protein YgfX n=1 Tax=Photobacterium sp. 1_MG-2023 TaxID=3062646 RepID=UPI0026E11F00|nr:protein YgfX [Photobacterium sp. 1_MG-2023]MDO6708030.1 protein YgfX [Photobacterium sp. 1_MG-2023]
MPTTRVSFANLTLSPSDFLLAALTGVYLTAASLFFFLTLTDLNWLPVFCLAVEFLLPEYIRAGHRLSQQHGRLILLTEREVDWYCRRWRLVHARLLTPYLLILDLDSAGDTLRLSVSRDSCTDQDFRLLSLFCRHQ